MYSYSEAINTLINRFSELREAYEQNFDEFENLPYLFYESIFTKFIMSKVNDNDENELKNIFLFIEEMLAHGDDKVRNLIEVAVIESLYFEDRLFAKGIIQKYFGKLTKKSFSECS